MPQGIAPLPDEEYALMGYVGHDVFLDDVNSIEGPQQRFIINAAHRLADAGWLAEKLDEDVSRHKGPPVVEGLLSLQLYLLLTCADTLGHIDHPHDKPKERFWGFFLDLPCSAQRTLVDAFQVWRVKQQELAEMRLADPRTGNVTLPSPELIKSVVIDHSADIRLEAALDFLYRFRRNPYTHEAEYPQLGHHPNLYVLQMLRLGVDSVATAGEYDRTQAVAEGSTYYFVYHGTNDPVASLRRVMLEGLGAITRKHLPA